MHGVAWRNALPSAPTPAVAGFPCPTQAALARQRRRTHTGPCGRGALRPEYYSGRESGCLLPCREKRLPCRELSQAGRLRPQLRLGPTPRGSGHGKLVCSRSRRWGPRRSVQGASSWCRLKPVGGLRDAEQTPHGLSIRSAEVFRGSKIASRRRVKGCPCTPLVVQGTPGRTRCAAPHTWTRAAPATPDTAPLGACPRIPVGCVAGASGADARRGSAGDATERTAEETQRGRRSAAAATRRDAATSGRRRCRTSSAILSVASPPPCS